MFWFLISSFFRFGTNSMKIPCAWSDKSSKQFWNHENHIMNNITIPQNAKTTQFDKKINNYLIINSQKAHDGQWKGSRSWYTSCFCFFVFQILTVDLDEQLTFKECFQTAWRRSCSLGFVRLSVLEFCSFS